MSTAKFGNISSVPSTSAKSALAIGSYSRPRDVTGFGFDEMLLQRQTGGFYRELNRDYFYFDRVPVFE